MAKSSNDIECQFFKLYLHHLASVKLRIPLAFLRSFNGTMPGMAILRDHAGKLWPVKLEEVGGNMFISNGWQNFATEHFLNDHDSLIFKYDRRSIFDVEIFSKYGCRKEIAETTCKRTTAIRREEETEEQQQPVSFPRQRTQRTLALRTPVPPQAVRKFTSKYPFFQVRLSQSYLEHANLTVPFKFAEMFFKKTNQNTIERTNGRTVTLQVGERSWPVKLILYPHLSMSKFSSGWAAFALDNSLKARNECVFEMIDIDVAILKVSILRHAD